MFEIKSVRRAPEGFKNAVGLVTFTYETEPFEPSIKTVRRANTGTDEKPKWDEFTTARVAAKGGGVLIIEVVDRPFGVSNGSAFLMSGDIPIDRTLSFQIADLAWQRLRVLDEAKTAAGRDPRSQYGAQTTGEAFA